ncbi:DUF6372 family protein [Streptomyces albireticuli]|uniref:DUF6372 family protein n=1 Tax=Streptomyces albireticuli TaxID=1940 RepID=UPI00117FB998|nr:DUF6372 family protein [Streptomyces albireticuli]MCD9194604.1 hypothetical protein [Streptomyces albireticuli]
MAPFGSLRHGRAPSPMIASTEQTEPCHCMCAVAHRGRHVCSEDAYPDLLLTLRLPAVGEVSFPVCEGCYEAATARSAPRL